LQHRAAQYYQQARIGLTGLSLDRVEKRIKESEQSASKITGGSLGGAEIRRLTGHKGSVNVVAFSADGKRALSGGSDGTLRVWDVASAREVYSLIQPPLPTSPNMPAEVRLAAWSNDGKYAASGHPQGNLVYWDLENKQPLSARGTQCNWVVFLPDNKVFAGRNIGWASVMGFIDKQSHMAHTTTPRSPVLSVAASPDGRAHVWGCADGSLYFSEMSRIGPRATGHTSEVVSVAVSRDAALVVSGSADATARLWNPATQQSLVTFTGHQGRVNSVAITPDSRRVVTAGDDKSIRIWDAKAGRELRRLTGHNGAVTCISLSPDGRYLLSASADQTIRMWALK
jgi:WD40 repeat protein